MAPWMLPAALAMMAGGQIWGAAEQNKSNKKRQRQMNQHLLPRLGGSGTGGMSEAEKMLMDFLGNQDVNQLFSGKAWNSGQDGLMQMLNQDTFDPAQLFASWEPIEQRAMNNALADSFGQASGLGQRFGSAMMREEGRVRGEGAENAAARRQETTVGLHESAQDRRLQAAQGLGNMGSQQAQLMLQFMSAMMGGMQGLGSLGESRGNRELGLLNMLFGFPAGGNAFPGAMTDMGGFLAMLPMLQSLMPGGGGGSTAGQGQTYAGTGRA
jgi:hypothetical protein